MEKKTDRRVRKTKTQLRAGLAKLMQTKSIKEITVKELVDEVDINRSTFYLHYTDIYQMLESIEDELEGEINQIVNNHPVDSYYKESFPMIKEILEVLCGLVEKSKLISAMPCLVQTETWHLCFVWNLLFHNTACMF